MEIIQPSNIQKRKDMLIKTHKLKEIQVTKASEQRLSTYLWFYSVPVFSGCHLLAGAGQCTSLWTPQVTKRHTLKSH